MSFIVTDPFLSTFYYVEKLNGLLRKNRGRGKNCQNHAYVINKWPLTILRIFVFAYFIFKKWLYDVRLIITSLIWFGIINWYYNCQNHLRMPTCCPWSRLLGRTRIKFTLDTHFNMRIFNIHFVIMILHLNYLTNSYLTLLTSLNLAIFDDNYARQC